MKKSTKITVPTRHHGYILVPREGDGMDLIDPSTGQWASFPTQRYAKWSSTFITNINKRFNEHPALKAYEMPRLPPKELT